MTLKALYRAALVIFFATVLTFPFFPLLNTSHKAEAAGPTNVGGLISVNTTWTVDNSPYTVINSVLVNSGVRLTIEPSVTVKFNTGKGMQINGELIAQGTETNPIVFTSNQPSPASGYWADVVFTDSSVDAQYDGDGNYLSGSIMQYCTVEYGGVSKVSAIKIVSSSPFLDHCTVRYNSGNGIYAENSCLKIANSTISNNSADDGGGIYVYYGKVTLYNNTISNNTIGGGLANGGGIYIWGGTTTLSSNTISNNLAGSISYGGGIYIYGGTVTLNSNTITNNSAVQGGGIYSFCGKITLNDNMIGNNSAPEGGGIYVWEGTATLTYNEIAGNSGGSGIYINSSQPIINYNSIHDNVPYDLYNTNPGGNPYVDATNNWWGTTDEAMIQDRIYDWFDDASLGVVDYIPYLLAPADSFIISGTICEVRGMVQPEGTKQLLSGVTITLVKDGVEIATTLSDDKGVYTITAHNVGDYTLCASKAGFKVEDQLISVTTQGQEYIFNFKGKTGLIPNAPDIWYLLDCAALWKYTPSDAELGLDIWRFLDVAAAWKYPI